MKDLLATIVRPLVSDPDSISITQQDLGHTVILQLHVAPDDMGKVIGKQGRRAQAIRAIVKAKAVRLGKKVVVDIV
jgi:predicted RNA-binding protein YlqC (UPF0109 family)